MNSAGHVPVPVILVPVEQPPPPAVNYVLDPAAGAVYRALPPPELPAPNFSLLTATAPVVVQHVVPQPSMVGYLPYGHVPQQAFVQMPLVQQASPRPADPDPPPALLAPAPGEDSDGEDDAEQTWHAQVKLAPPSLHRPCPHNDWDDVRTRRHAKILQCRVCFAKWKLVSSAMRCTFFLHSRCEKGDRCHLLHVHKKRVERGAREVLFDKLRTETKLKLVSAAPPSGKE